MSTPLTEKLKKELEGLPEAVQENFGRVIKIGETLEEIYAQSRARHEAPSQVADRKAQQRIRRDGQSE